MFRSTFLLILIFLAIPTHVYALASDWQKDEAVNVRLISGIDGVGQETSISLGLEVQLEPQWHTYWRSPGAAGLPPGINWQESLSEAGNLKEAKLLYPTPKRYTAYGLETIGYRDHVVFPIDAMPAIVGKALVLDASVDLLVCSAICVPKNFVIKLTIPEGEAKESVEASLIRKFRGDIPGDAVASGLVLKSIVNYGQGLIITFESSGALQAPDIFIENEKNISFGAPRITLSPSRQSVEFNLKPADTLPEGVKLAGMPLTMTVIDGDRALEQKITTPEVTEAADPSAPASIKLGLAILFALIGGLILNLMPCVLPILSLKIFNVINHGGGEARMVRQSFLVTAAGILSSFLILALMTIVLKELGLSLGWGVQFQQPAFLIILILLLTFFAASMWGMFDVQLPQWLADNLNDAAYHPKLAGDFATGAFATLLATPCTAPFLGTAIGFALASGPLDILIIFTALGFGMILPYLAIAGFPRVATIFPKPGAWMIRLRHILGWALGFTALWLLWVLSAQITPRYTSIIGLCMLGILILLRMKKTAISQRLIRLGILDFVLVAAGLTIAGSMMPKVPPQVEALWLPFSEKVIAADVEEGKTVFVDITADWCLTCKANKKFVLTKGDVAERLFHSDVIAMQGDWTNPDPTISEFLHKYRRYGIPFNAVFGPGAPQGLVLPELLTSKIVLEAVDKAATPPKP